jgi:ribonuclease D
MDFKESITKEELSELPTGHFEGEIVIVNNTDEAEEAVSYLKKFPFLGFDTETRPSFKKGQVHKVALLQLSTNEKAFLFKVSQFDLTNSMVKLLSDKNIVKAGAAIRDDIKALQINRPFKPAGFVELQDIAQKLGIINFSLKNMAGIVLGIKISKAQQLSNWEATELSAPQMIYAATDAWISYKLYEQFSKQQND